MQDILGRDGFAPDAAFGEGHILGHLAIEVVADHQHVEMFFDGIHRVGHGGVGGRGQDVLAGHHLDDIGRVAAACPFGMEGMDRAPPDRGQRVFDKAAFVQRIGMDHHLNIHRIGHRQAAVDGGGGGSPILVQFQAGGPGADLFLKRGGK